MKTLIEVASFLAVAVAAHVGGFALLTQGGAGAGGDGGAGQITLEGGGPDHAAMVAAWESPPELTPPPEALPAPLPDDATDPRDISGDLPPLPAPQAPGVAPVQGMAPPETTADTLPDTAPPARPPAPPVAWAPPPDPAPDPAPDLPDPAPAPDALPTLSTTPLPALSGLLAPLPDAPAPDATLPDTTAPPPLASAAPPARSPYPPARPEARAEARPEARPEPRTEPRAPAAPAAMPAQRAAGSGGQGQAGLAAGTHQTSRAGVDTGGLVAQWGGAVRAAIQRVQRRPAHGHGTGTVVLRLEVHSQGRLLSVAVQQSSGHAALDQAALDAARRARLPAAPGGLSGTFRFNLPIRFRG